MDGTETSWMTVAKDAALDMRALQPIKYVECKEEKGHGNQRPRQLMVFQSCVVLMNSGKASYVHYDIQDRLYHDTI